jgi:hypothetical protein
MIATITDTARARPRVFQFRLGTLLVAMAWVGLVSLALRTPTVFWSGVIAAFTLLAVLLAVLVVIYRTGRTRATAIGFLVFCVGYLAYLGLLDGTLSAGLSSTTTPTGTAFMRLFEIVHPDIIEERTDENGNVIATFMRQRTYNLNDFISICNHALACLLGLAGAIAAQVLYATRRDESPNPPRSL